MQEGAGDSCEWGRGDGGMEGEEGQNKLELDICFILAWGEGLLVERIVVLDLFFKSDFDFGR